MAQRVRKERSDKGMPKYVTWNSHTGTVHLQINLPPAEKEMFRTLCIEELRTADNLATYVLRRYLTEELEKRTAPVNGSHSPRGK